MRSSPSLRVRPRGPARARRAAGQRRHIRPSTSERYLRVHLAEVGLTLGARQILRAIDWNIRPGQRWVLMGPNGAGKTLLLKLLAGDIWPTPGRGRRSYRWRGERFDQPYGVRQEIIYIGSERQDRYEHYRWNYSVEAVVGSGVHRTDIALDPLTAQQRRRVMALLKRLRLQQLARRRFLTLSYGERRLVLLARALAAAPRLLLLDELFNGLDERNRERAMHCLRVLSRSALPWVLATHRPEEIPPTATHCAELRNGSLHQRRLPRTPKEARSPERAGWLQSASARAASAASTPLVRLRNVTVWRDGVAALRGLSLELRRGECWVVHGPNGSGKSSLIQALYGDLSAARGGAIEREGVGRGVPLAQFRRRVGLVAPELQALHARYLRVEEVVASGLTASIATGGAGKAGSPSRSVLRALRRVGAAGLAGRTLRTLSYGQLRRVLFARALVGEPDILLLDEPYAGLDVPTRARLRTLVESIARSGVSVVISTHHRDEWPAQASHELQLERGHVRYRGEPRQRRALRVERRRGA